jgi:antitoxin component of MazEF toxin-antitoxin module
MRASKWGNSLAIRLPATVVEALELKDGDQIEIRIAGETTTKLFNIAHRGQIDENPTILADGRPIRRNPSLSRPHVRRVEPTRNDRYVNGCGGLQ